MARMSKEERMNAFYAEGVKQHMKSWSEIAIEQQDRREGPLVEALRFAEVHAAPGGAIGRVVGAALAQYEALDAKPEPTLLEAAKAVKTMDIRGARGEEYVLILKADADALKAAVEREERCAGERKGK